MKIRLQEIELGSNDPEKSKLFYTSILGLKTSVDKEGLKVFKSGSEGIDFNVSTHLPSKTMSISFLTDDLQNIIEVLSAHNIAFDGPKKSHLGMMTIEFNDPDGYLIKINQSTEESPKWLKI